VTSLEAKAAQTADQALQVATLLEKLNHWASGQAAREAKRAARALDSLNRDREGPEEEEEEDLVTRTKRFLSA
jgi:hypothetical protein